MKFLTACILSSLILFESAHAQALSGKELYREYVEYAKQRVEDGIAVGHYMGLIDGIAYALVNNDKICFSYGVTNQQTYDVVGLYLTNHPETQQKTAGFLITTALISAFPCGQKNLTK